MIERSKEIKKKIDELEDRLKSIESSIKSSSEILTLGYYTDRLSTVDNELRDLETLLRELRALKISKKEKPEKYEGLKSTLSSKKDKLQSKIADLNKSLESAKEKDKSKIHSKLREAYKQVDNLEKEYKKVEEKIALLKKLSTLNEEELNKKKSELLDQKLYLRRKIGEIKGEDVVIGSENCVICGGPIINSKCHECGAKILSKEVAVKSPQIKKIGLLLKLSTLFFIIGIIMLIVGIFIYT